MTKINSYSFIAYSLFYT